MLTENIEKGVRLLKKHNVRVVVFDMDQTAIAAHSRGTLLRSNFKQFTSKATPAFLQLVSALHHEGSFHEAIATHSDEAEFQNGRHVGKVHPLTHIMVAQSILVVSYNPRARGTMEDPESCVKRYHMREIKNHFKASSEEMIFFDDTLEIVKDCIENCGIKAVLVDADNGFQIEDLINAFADDQ